VQLRELNFGQFASNHQGGDAHELELLPGNLGAFNYAVQNADGGEEGFRLQVELQVHFDQPVDQDWTHFLVQVLLNQSWRHRVLTHYVGEYFRLVDWNFLWVFKFCHYLHSFLLFFLFYLWIFSNFTVWILLQLVMSFPNYLKVWV